MKKENWRNVIRKLEQNIFGEENKPKYLRIYIEFPGKSSVIEAWSLLGWQIKFHAGINHDDSHAVRVNVCENAQPEPAFQEML
jgi:hypothetical protein